MDGSLVFSTERRDVTPKNENSENFCQVEGGRVEFFFVLHRLQKFLETCQDPMMRTLETGVQFPGYFFQKYFVFYEFDFPYFCIQSFGHFLFAKMHLRDKMYLSQNMKCEECWWTECEGPGIPCKINPNIKFYTWYFQTKKNSSNTFKVLEKHWEFEQKINMKKTNFFLFLYTIFVQLFISSKIPFFTKFEFF
jgi:hypothetical protein